MSVTRLLIGAVLWLGLAAPVSAATVTLAWDPNPEPDVSNYNVFVRTANGSFTTGIPVGNRTNWTFTGLQGGVQYYFAVQAQSPSGLSALSQIPYTMPFPNAPGTEQSRSDFNADGKFDLIWQNQTTGQLIAWHMNGAATLSARFLTPSQVAREWKLKGSGDLNQDGKADLIWEHSVTGDLYYYLMDGTMAFAMGPLSPSKVDPAWQIASVRDLDRDGFPDILWNNINTGQVIAWYMNGATMVRQGWINQNPLADKNWRVRGTADFDRDGQADVVWQHEQTGQPMLWYMSGNVPKAAHLLPTPGTGTWKIRAVGDANVDGWPDLVFENVNTGGVVIWAMQNRTVFSAPYVGTVDPIWVISAPK
jgi:hypothetical protein